MGDSVTLADPITVQSMPAGTLSGAGAVSVSAAGLVGYRAGVATGQRQLTWFDRTGKTLGVLGGPDESALSSPELSPDGRFVLFEISDPGRNDDLWAVPLEGDRKPQAFLNTSFFEQGGQFSPDGRWVAYVSNESGLYQVYVRPFPGPDGQWEVSTSGGSQPRWRSDGKELYYIAPEGTLMAASVAVNGAAFQPGGPVALFQPPIFGGGTNIGQQQYDVAPDGRFLINVTIGEETAAPITLLMNWRPPAP